MAYFDALFDDPILPLINSPHLQITLSFLALVEILLLSLLPPRSGGTIAAYILIQVSIDWAGRACINIRLR